MIDNQWYDYRQEDLFQNDEVYQEEEEEELNKEKEYWFDVNKYDWNILINYFGYEF
jgi:hypothetical protein